MTEADLDVTPEELDELLRRTCMATAEFWEHAPRAMGQRWERWDDLRAADPGTLSPYPNSATLLRPIEEEEAADVAGRLDDFYSGGGGGGYMLWAGWPTPDLTPFGFTGPMRPPFMVRQPGTPAEAAPRELAIDEVQDADALAEFEQVLVDGYPAPEMQPVRRGSVFDKRVLGDDSYRLFVGRVDGRAVSIAAGCAAYGVVGVNDVATLPDARGRGYGGAVTLVAGEMAPDLPCVLQASDVGAPVYARIGYRKLSDFTLWLKRER